MRSKLNLLLAALVVVVLGLDVALRPRPTARNFEFLPQMAHSLAYESFAENPNFADGKSLQTLPAHTIVRGAMPLSYAATPEDARRAGAELANPFAPSDTAADARGARVFASFCQVCHGPRGQGDGPVAQRGFPAPPSLRAPNALGLRDGQIFQILTYGQNAMPGYAAQISRADRWRAVLHVRRLQAEAAGAAASAQPPASPAP